MRVIGTYVQEKSFSRILKQSRNYCFIREKNNVRYRWKSFRNEMIFVTFLGLQKTLLSKFIRICLTSYLEDEYIEQN